MPLADVESHAALLDAFHAHPDCVVTLTDAAPADATTFAAELPSANVQPVVPPCFDARKFATVSAFWLCTRAVSAVEDEPVGSGGLP